MGSSNAKIEYKVACEVENHEDPTAEVTCDIDIRIPCAHGVLPTILHYGMTSGKVYFHKVLHSDVGNAEYVECAVRRGAPSARGARIKSTAPSFLIKQVHITEMREDELLERIFRRNLPVQLGDSLGISVLLQPVQRSGVFNEPNPRFETLIMQQQSNKLKTIQEEEEDNGSGTGLNASDVHVSVSEEVV